MNKAYIGIDPGSKGFVAFQKNGVFEYHAIDGCDWALLFEQFFKWRNENEEIICAIEDVHAIYGSSAEATFNFGYVCGMLKMILIGSRIPYVMVQPKEWQKEMWMNSDVISHKEVSTRKDGKTICRTIIDTKKTSINAAKRLFPTIDFRKDDSPKSRCKNVDDNKVDSTLICEYARRKNF